MVGIMSINIIEPANFLSLNPMPRRKEVNIAVIYSFKALFSD